MYFGIFGAFCTVLVLYTVHEHLCEHLYEYLYMNTFHEQRGRDRSTTRIACAALHNTFAITAAPPLVDRRVRRHLAQSEPPNTSRASPSFSLCAASYRHTNDGNSRRYLASFLSFYQLLGAELPYLGTPLLPHIECPCGIATGTYRSLREP